MDSQALERVAAEAVRSFRVAGVSSGESFSTKASSIVAEAVRPHNLNPEQVQRVCVSFNRQVLDGEKRSFANELWKSRIPTAKPEEVLAMLGTPKTSSASKDIWSSRPTYESMRVTSAALRGELEGFAKVSAHVIAGTVAEGLRILDEQEQEIANAVAGGRQYLSAAQSDLTNTESDLILEMAKCSAAGLYPGEVAALVNHLCAKCGISPDPMVGRYLHEGTQKVSHALRLTATSSAADWAESTEELTIRPEVLLALGADRIKESHPVSLKVSEIAQKQRALAEAQEAMEHLDAALVSMRSIRAEARL